MIRVLTVLSIVVATTLGFYAPSLKVRFDFTCVGIGTTAFIELPQNVTSATASGWVNKTKPDIPSGLSSLELWCPQADYTICLFYDDTGYVAGLQIAFDKELISNAVYDWKVQGFTNWTTTLNETTKNYYTTQQYYVSSETLAEDAATRIAARNSSLLLQEESLWVSGINGLIHEISTDANNITSADSIFTKQQCVPRMVEDLTQNDPTQDDGNCNLKETMKNQEGYHYYYNITTSSDCVDEDMFPWFVLIDHDQLVGIGFNVFAEYTIGSGSTNWFEYSGETAIRYTVPYGPECLYEVASIVGQVTLHTYFIESPYDIVCLA